MVLAAGDSNHRPYVSHDRKMAKQWARVTIGGTGAATIALGSAGLTCVRNAAGVYDVTFRGGVDGLPLPIGIKSAIPTVFYAVWLAFDPVAGTGQFRTCVAAGTALDPASGDVLSIEVDVLPNKDI